MSSFFPGMRPVELIPGDPVELRWLAGRLGVLAEGLGQTAHDLTAIDAHDWTGPAADAFRQAVKVQPGRYNAAATSFNTASNSLTAYANALETAQQDASRAISAHQEADNASQAWQQRQQAAAQAATNATKNGHPTPDQPPSNDPGDTGRAQAETTLQNARLNLDLAATRLKTTLQDAQTTAPSQSALHHDEALLHAFTVVGAPFAINDAVKNFASVSRLIHGLRTGKLQAIGDSRQAVAAAELEHGAADIRTLNAYLAWEQNVSRYAPLRSAAQAGGYFKNPAELLRTGIPAFEATHAGTVLRVGGKALGVLSIPINLAIVAKGSQYGDGVRGDTDRAVSGLAVLGVVAELSPLAATPVGAIVIGGILGGVAVWQISNLVYDYRHEIAHAAVAGAQEIWRYKSQFADLTIPGYVIWDQRHELAHIATAGLHDGEHIATAGLHDGQHVVNQGLHDLASAKSTAEHAVASGTHTVTSWLGFGH